MVALHDAGWDLRIDLHRIAGAVAHSHLPPAQLEQRIGSRQPAAAAVTG